MKHIFTSKQCPALVFGLLVANLTFAQSFGLLKDNSPAVSASIHLPSGAITHLTTDDEKYKHESAGLSDRLPLPSANDLAAPHLSSVSGGNQLPDEPYYVFASVERVCSGDSIYLMATCPNGNVVWYLNATATTPIGTGAPLTTYPITNTTYYAACDYDFQESARVATGQVVVVAKPGIPTNVAVNKTMVCRGSEVILSGSCTDGTLVWFMSEGDTMSVGTSTNLHATPMDATRYYAACTSIYCISQRISTDEIVVMALPESPTQILSDRNEICRSAYINLSASCSTGTVSWYSTEVGGVVLDSGTQSPEQDAVYYASCSYNMCESPRLPSTQIKVIPQPELPTNIIANKRDICKGESVVLSATCAIGTAYWYTYPIGIRTLQGSGSSITVTPDSTIAYYVSCENGLCISERLYAGEITVNEKPTAPANIAVNHTEVCSGSPVSLSATTQAGTLKWYTTASGGTSIGSGNNLSHSPTADIMYYAACEAGGCASARVASAQLLVKPKPDKPTVAGNTSICRGDTIQLTSSIPSANAVCSWSNGLTGTSVSVSPGTSGSYRVSVFAFGCSSDSSEVFTITVNPLPDAPTITTNNPAICKGGSALLTGRPANQTDTFYWSTPTLNNTANAGNSNTRVVTEPGIYKGWSQSASGCVSAESSIIIMQAANCNGQSFITITPEKPVVCPNTSIILSANGCSGTITWTDGSSSYTGTSVKVSPMVTTSYMAQCSSGGTATTDVVVAQTNVTVTNHVATGIERVKAILTLESSRKIGEPDYTPAANVSFEAGSYILLKPGFEVEKHSVFSAVIKGCE